MLDDLEHIGRWNELTTLGNVSRPVTYREEGIALDKTLRYGVAEDHASMVQALMNRGSSKAICDHLLTVRFCIVS